MGWRLLNRIDRVYDCRAASTALGYQLTQDVAGLLTSELRRHPHSPVTPVMMIHIRPGLPPNDQFGTPFQLRPTNFQALV